MGRIAVGIARRTPPCRSLKEEGDLGEEVSVEVDKSSGEAFRSLSTFLLVFFYFVLIRCHAWMFFDSCFSCPVSLASPPAKALSLFPAMPGGCSSIPPNLHHPQSPPWFVCSTPTYHISQY